MNYLLGTYKVDDVEAWKSIIASHREAHLSAGLHFQQVWSNVDNPREIFFLFRVDDVDKARLFLTEAGALDLEKQQRGEIPELRFLTER